MQYSVSYYDQEQGFRKFVSEASKDLSAYYVATVKGRPLIAPNGLAASIQFAESKGNQLIVKNVLGECK